MCIQKILCYCIGFFLIRIAVGQGCSDAGFCSIGSLQSSANDTSSTNLSVGQTVEMGERFTLISTSQLDLQIALSKKNVISIKSFYFFASGDLGSSNDIGDVTISYTQQISSNEQYATYLNIGGKVPTNSSNIAKPDGRPLPMPYQSSLGTYDIILGASIYFPSWRFSFGYQHPLNANENNFLHTSWNGDNYALRYFESNQFRRGNDIMLRVEKILTKENNSYSLSILPIYRIKKDEILKNNETIQLKGSNELTVNLNFNFMHSITNKIKSRFSFGSPIWWRETRADGLTRFFVFYGGLELQL